MGQQASAPRPGTTLQIIGAGLPRTGTASFCAALTILLDAPVYHGGTQITRGPEANIRGWSAIFAATPIRTPADRAFILREIRTRLDGYAATADTPGAHFVPELLELYPDAKVICTVRNPDAWARSVDAVASMSLGWYLRIILLPLPALRFFPHYLDVLQAGRWGELYHRPGDPTTYGRAVWDRHMDWLRRVVPKEKLIFYSVKDGWPPLCEALGVPEPKGVPFPNINDGDAIEAFAKAQVLRGLLVWAVILAVLAVVVGVGIRLWSR